MDAVRSHALVAMTATALLAVPDAAGLDPSRAFLTTAFHLSASEMERIDGGQVVSRTLEVKNHRELATLGIVRIKTSPAVYVERLSDIATFKRTDDVLQVGVFSDPPQVRDVAALNIDDGDLKQLRVCQVENCDVRLGADTIELLRRQIDWRTADAPRQANQQMLQMLVDLVGSYRHSGPAAVMEYADRAPRLDARREFAALLDGDPITLEYAPRLRRHLLEYPASGEKMTDFIYWSKELVRGRPVISVTHVATGAAVDDSPVAYAIGSKQLYATHYYDASLGLTLLVPDRTAASPATYVVYLNRTRIDLFDGLFGGVTRRIVGGRARTLVAAQLQRLQRELSGASARPVESRVR